jgi:uncharacterized membrane protein
MAAIISSLNEMRVTVGHMFLLLLLFLFFLYWSNAIHKSKDISPYEKWDTFTEDTNLLY